MKCAQMHTVQICCQLNKKYMFGSVSQAEREDRSLRDKQKRTDWGPPFAFPDLTLYLWPLTFEAWKDLAA